MEGHKNLAKNNFQQKCIAFYDSYRSTSPENHLNFFDLSTDLALKHIKTTSIQYI
jgi:hypothetical protein